MILPDVNVWVSLTIDAHVHHASAKRWFLSLSEERLFICRNTQQGFFRLITNPKVFGTSTLTMAQAWQKYDELLNDARIEFLHEPVGVETLFRQYTQRGQFSPKLWNDAYLAAFAQTLGLQMVTFDQGFQQFPGLNHLILT